MTYGDQLRAEQRALVRMHDDLLAALVRYGIRPSYQHRLDAITARLAAIDLLLGPLHGP